MYYKYKNINYFFYKPRRGNALCKVGGTHKGISVPTKTSPLLKQQSHIQDKQRAMNQRP